MMQSLEVIISLPHLQLLVVTPGLAILASRFGSIINDNLNIAIKRFCICTTVIKNQPLVGVAMCGFQLG